MFQSHGISTRIYVQPVAALHTEHRFLDTVQFRSSREISFVLYDPGTIEMYGTSKWSRQRVTSPSFSLGNSVDVA